MISVIVPVYNAEKYLSKCLDSILSQSYKDLEIILINDGSSDNSKNLCQQYQKKDERIIFIDKENGGPSSARNMGIDRAKGDYLSFIDSDDYLANDFYEKLIDNIKINNSDIAFCKYSICNGDKVRVKEEKGLHEFVLDRNLAHFFQSKGHINAYLCRCLFKREIVGTLRYDETIRYMEDMDLFMRIFLKNPKMSLQDEHLYFYEQTPNSITRKTDKKMVERFEKGVEKCSKDLFELGLNELAFSSRFECFIKANNYYVETKDKVALKEFDKKYNTKENYKVYRKYNSTLKNKLVSFLAHHRILWLYKILKKMKKSF